MKPDRQLSGQSRRQEARSGLRKTPHDDQGLASQPRDGAPASDHPAVPAARDLLDTAREEARQAMRKAWRLVEASEAEEDYEEAAALVARASLSLRRAESAFRSAHSWSHFLPPEVPAAWRKA